MVAKSSEAKLTIAVQLSFIGPSKELFLTFNKVKVGELDKDFGIIPVKPFECAMKEASFSNLSKTSGMVPEKPFEDISK